MTRFVVDASVAVKWLPLFIAEPLVGQAKHLLGRRSRGEIHMLVPDLFWLEVASVLCKAVKRGSCGPDEANAALATLQQESLATVGASVSLINPAQEIALQYGRSVYDSLYIALARASGCDLITADEKLANAIGAYLPVKWLGAF